MNVCYGVSMVGQVLVIKMCCSVMIKGFEVFIIECLFVVCEYGVEEEVFSFLYYSFFFLGWIGVFFDYLISWVVEYGIWCSEEMEEVVKILCDVGSVGIMSEVIVKS